MSTWRKWLLLAVLSAGLLLPSLVTSTEAMTYEECVQSAQRAYRDCLSGAVRNMALAAFAGAQAAGPIGALIGTGVVGAVSVPVCYQTFNGALTSCEALANQWP